VPRSAACEPLSSSQTSLSPLPSLPPRAGLKADHSGIFLQYLSMCIDVVLMGCQAVVESCAALAGSRAIDLFATHSQPKSLAPESLPQPPPHPLPPHTADIIHSTLNLPPSKKASTLSSRSSIPSSHLAHATSASALSSPSRAHTPSLDGHALISSLNSGRTTHEKYRA